MCKYQFDTPRPIVDFFYIASHKQLFSGREYVHHGKS